MRLSQTKNADAAPLEEVVLKLASDKIGGSYSSTPECGESELHYLRIAGCLDLPPSHIISALVDAYFGIFHPFFPVVEKSQFLRSLQALQNEMIPQDKKQHTHSPATVKSTHDYPQYSLLLTQAVLFIAMGVAPSKFITAAGFSSRKQARHTYYFKARRLYDMDHEEDPIATIQALLLISQYYPSITERKHTWHWIHQAISLSQVSGLHRDPGQVPHRAQWARIWWACVVRDRCNALGTGRPLVSLLCLHCCLSLNVSAMSACKQECEVFRYCLG